MPLECGGHAAALAGRELKAGGMAAALHSRHTLITMLGYQLSPHVLATVLTALATLSLGGFVAFRQRSHRLGRLFGLLSLAVAWWLLSFSLMTAADAASTAKLWARVGWIAIPFITPAAYHFSVDLLRLGQRRRKVIALGWSLALIFSLLAAGTDLVVAAVRPYPWGWHPVLAPAGVAALVFTIAWLFLTLLEYWLNYQNEKSFSNRARVRAFMVAFTLGSVGAIESFVYLSSSRFVVYPIGYIAVLLFLLLAMRTIHRYRLVDITPSFAADEIVATMADALIVCDAEGSIRVVNHAVRSMFGYEPTELVGRSIEVLVDSGTTSEERLGPLLHGGTLRDQERVFRTKDGQPVEVSLSVSQLRDEDVVAGSVVIARDIRERKRAEVQIKENVTLLESTLEALKASESRYRLLFERNSAGVFRNTLDGRIIDCNQACAKILGYGSRRELMKANALDFYADQHERDTILDLLREVGTLTNLELKLKRKDGSEIWVLENVSLLRARGGEPATVEGTLFEITDRKLAEEQIEFHAYHDVLTTLPNRKLFTDRLTLALFHARRSGNALAVMFMDIDHFKSVNDTLGHTAGDELLITMAERLSKAVREGDTVARMGGDEFTLLVPELKHPEDAAKIAENVLARIGQPTQVGDRQLVVTASIGIALYPSDGNDAETLLKNADGALYLAKQAGRNNYQMCTPAMKVQAQERLSLENALRTALENNQFQLSFQPLINLERGRVTGLEALIRWNHSERGLLVAEDFIPMAEDSRLIVPIGDWVLREACHQAREWTQDSLPEVRVSVNFSARQFRQRGLVSRVHATLEETGLAPERLELEITEATAMQNADFTIEVLRQLRQIGITISIDDFGTGYTSLHYLKQFPINTVKIDKAFVRDVNTDSGHAAIVSAVIGIAKSLNLRVIAEGVETREQLAFLRQRRCEEMQGFLFGQPLPADSVRQKIRSGEYFEEAISRLG